MKKYSSAAVAIALGVSENTIESLYEGASKKGLDIAQILQLDSNEKLKRYHEEAAKIKQLVANIKALEE